MQLFVVFVGSAFTLVVGDQCTEHVLSGGSHDGAHGIGCIKSGCCQQGLEIVELCAGTDVCCFTSDTCAGSSATASTGGADTPCTSQGGHCQDDSGACGGHYQSGLCDGAANRRCCLPATSGTSAGCPNIVSRAEWGAKAPAHALSNMAAPAQYVFIHHGSSAPCHDQASCMSILRSYQNYHMSPAPQGHGWTDIGYNFIVGEDGHAYMGRGWTAVGAHTQGYNSVGIAICVIGDFNTHVPNDAALTTIKALIQCGLSNGHVSQSYTLKGHRDVGETDCPGTALYNLIHSWPHYASGTQKFGR